MWNIFNRKCYWLPQYSRYVCVVVSLVLLQTPLQGGDYGATIHKDFYQAFQTGLALVQSPLDYDRQDWTRMGGATAVTLLLFSLDKNTSKLFLRQKSPLNDRIFRIDNFHGTEYSLLTAFGIYGYGLVTDRGDIRILGLKASEAFIFSGGITNALKFLIGRQRPYASHDNLVFEPFKHGFDNTYLSLPSGHTTAAFSVSTVLASYSDKWAWKTVCYGSAVLVGGARVYHDRHWLSDVFLGGMIGYGTGKFVLQYGKKDHESKYSMTPIVTPTGLGILLHF